MDTQRDLVDYLFCPLYRPTHDRQSTIDSKYSKKNIDSRDIREWCHKNDIKGQYGECVTKLVNFL